MQDCSDCFILQSNFLENLPPSWNQFELQNESQLGHSRSSKPGICDYFDFNILLSYFCIRIYYKFINLFLRAFCPRGHSKRSWKSRIFVPNKCKFSSRQECLSRVALLVTDSLRSREHWRRWVIKVFPLSLRKFISSRVMRFLLVKPPCEQNTSYLEILVSFPPLFISEFLNTFCN